MKRNNQINNKQNSQSNNSFINLDEKELIDYMDMDDSDEYDLMPEPMPLPKIYVGSRTHKQVSQLIGELKGHTPYRPKMTVLGSREQYCIHHNVSKSEHKDDDCNNMVQTRSCSFYNHKDDLMSDPRIQPGGSKEIWDIEDLSLLGRQVGGCPYYVSRQLADTAELIICPYNYLIDPIIRNAMNIDTANNIIILDEAHNIETASREAGTFEMDDLTVNVIALELRHVIENGYLQKAHIHLLDLLGYITQWMNKSGTVFDKKESDQDLCVLPTGDELRETLDEAFSINAVTLRKTLYPAYSLVCRHAERMRAQTHDTQDSQEQMHRTHLSVASLNNFEKLLLVTKYICDKSKRYHEDYHLVLMKNKSTNYTERRWERKMGLWCMNPAVIFQDISKKAHSIILTSGTLNPVITFEAELGTKFPITLEANHVIKSSQVFVQNIPYGPSRKPLKGIYTVTSTKAYQDDIGEAILGICKAVPYGILVFVTSYVLLEKLHDRWEKTGLLDRIKAKKHVIKEPRLGSTGHFNRTLQKFYNYIKKAESSTGPVDGAIFFAVYRGKVSEGIDFNNNYCRAVIATGIPYPMCKDNKVILKKAYNDLKSSEEENYLTGDHWYTIQAFRAINQALGRCIRHRNDWGAIILLEERFMDGRNSLNLSKWIKKLCVFRNDNFGAIMNDLAEFTKLRLLEDTTPGPTSQSSIEIQHELVTQEVQRYQVQLHRQEQQEQEPHQQEHHQQEQYQQRQQDDHTTNEDHMQQLSISSNEQSRQYVVSCRECDKQQMVATFEPFAFKSRSTYLHYLYNLAEQPNSNIPVAVLEMDLKKSLWKACGGDNDTSGYLIQPTCATTTATYTDVHWHSVDRIVYRPFQCQCCSRIIGAEVVTTTLESDDSNKYLISKLLLVKSLVEVSLV
ncbi:helicase C-terminal domain-containing protein [Chlamydoabsidia padenii]|nr:helicase C-terminal domain-containing protein [Chlamydoabsidia padenii]